MMILSKNALEDQGYKLVVKMNGDVVVEPIDRNTALMDKLDELMEEAYPMIGHDSRQELVGQMVMKAECQNIAAVAAGISDKDRRRAHRSRVMDEMSFNFGND